MNYGVLLYICNTNFSYFRLKMLFHIQADVDNNGTIDYGEFIAATLHLNKVEKEDHLFAAFSYFDKDGSGYITQDELQQACEEFGIDNTQLDEMIKEADQNNVSVLIIMHNSISYPVVILYSQSVPHL